MEQQKVNKQQVQSIKQYIAQKIINQKIIKQQEIRIKEMQYTRHQCHTLMEQVRGLTRTPTSLTETFRSSIVGAITMAPLQVPSFSAAAMAVLAATVRFARCWLLSTLM